MMFHHHGGICPKGSKHSVRNTGYIDLVIITVVVKRLEDSWDYSDKLSSDSRRD